MKIIKLFTLIIIILMTSDSYSNNHIQFSKGNKKANKRAVELINDFYNGVPFHRGGGFVLQSNMASGSSCKIINTIHTSALPFISIRVDQKNKSILEILTKINEKKKKIEEKVLNNMGIIRNIMIPYGPVRGNHPNYFRYLQNDKMIITLETKNKNGQIINKNITVDIGKHYQTSISFSNSKLDTYYKCPWDINLLLNKQLKHAQKNRFDEKQIKKERAVEDFKLSEKKKRLKEDPKFFREKKASCTRIRGMIKTNPQIIATPMFKECNDLGLLYYK